MSGMFRSLTRNSSLNSVSSFASSSIIPTINKFSIRNLEDISFDDIEKSIQDWTIPKVSLKEIYKQSPFKIKSDYVIKTVEETKSIQQNEENLYPIPMER